MLVVPWNSVKLSFEEIATLVTEFPQQRTVSYVTQLEVSPFHFIGIFFPQYGTYRMTWFFDHLPQDFTA